MGVFGVESPDAPEVDDDELEEPPDEVDPELELPVGEVWLGLFRLEEVVERFGFVGD